MLDVLTRFRAGDVEKAVNALSTDELDILMKYVYRGFAYPTENSCGILLVWHEKVGALVGTTWNLTLLLDSGSCRGGVHLASDDGQKNRMK